MKETFKINSQSQTKSISNGFGLLLVVPTVTLILLYLTGQVEILYEADFFIIMFCFITVFFLPALYFHLTYFFANKDTVVEVDKENNTLTIINGNDVKILSTPQLKQIIKVINPDFKHPKWQQNWQPLPWRNYGYIKLVTHDNQVFILTSLMLDPTKPPIKETEIQYRLFPDLDYSVYEEPTQEELALEQREVVETFKQKYQNQSQEELLMKRRNNGFKKEAVIAAQELLKEKFGYQQST